MNRCAALGTIALLVAAGCKDNGPTFGAIRVSVATTGGDLDLDGYGLRLDSSSSQALTVNDTTIFSRVATGAHEVALGDVAPNCAVTDGDSRSVTVRNGRTADVAFGIGCVATGVEVTVATGGVDADPDGYTVSVDGAPPLPIPLNGSVRITRLSPGTHTVTLSGLAGNCAEPDETNPRSVDVPAGEVVPVAFPVTCSAVHGVVEVTAVTAGMELDPNGYIVQLDSGAPQPLPVNGTFSFGAVSGGEHTITLGEAAGNCTVGAANPRTVSVTTGGVTRDTARTTFEVTCVATTGTIEVTVATAGFDLDADGYLVAVDEECLPDWDGGWSCRYVRTAGANANDTVRFDRVAVGGHVVYLDNIARNCRLVAPEQTLVTVAPGETATIAFAVTCEQSGNVRVNVTTTGTDIDPDGYLVQGSWYGDHTMGVNASLTIPRLFPGEYSVTLSGLTGSCTVNGQNPVTVTVGAGVTVDVAFAVTCAALGSIQLTAVTTGVDLDGDGYGVQVQGAGFDQTYSVSTNGTLTAPRLVPGDYVVALHWEALNCEPSSQNPQTVAVPSGGTALVQFDVACAALAQLAVVSPSDGDAEIYLVQSNGTGLTRLTTNTASDMQPAWSPDGGKIAFATNRDGNYEIYVMDAEGRNPVRRTTTHGADYSPAWSPDASKIAFTSERDGNAEIYVMDADGSNAVRLTNHSGSDADPAWSPDGSKIAFSSTRDGNAEIYVMDPAGSGLTRLTSNMVDDVQPEWSPDGTKLVFSRFDGLFVMNADGSGTAQVTFASSVETHNDPVWSPAGRWIVFGASFYGYSCGWDPGDDCIRYYDHSAVQVVRADRSRAAELVRDALQPAWRR